MLDLDETLTALAAHTDACAPLLGEMTDADFRTKLVAFDGNTTTRGAFIVNVVLRGCAAYR